MQGGKLRAKEKELRTRIREQGTFEECENSHLEEIINFEGNKEADIEERRR